MKPSYYAIPGLPEATKVIYNPFKETVASTPKKSTDATIIMATCCRVIGVNFDDIDTPKRKRYMVWARQTIMYCLRKHSTYSLKRIGQCFNQHFNHATILHGLRQYDDLWPQSKETKRVHYALEEEFKRIFG